MSDELGTELEEASAEGQNGGDQDAGDQNGGDQSGGDQNEGNQTGGDESTEEQPTEVSQPKGITTDEKKRYLVEIVANHGLSKAAGKIATAIGDYSGILIVDDLAFAINDIFYRDIQNKLNTLRKLVRDESAQCRELWTDLTIQDEEAKTTAESIGQFDEALKRDLEKKMEEIRKKAKMPGVSIMAVGPAIAVSSMLKTAALAATDIGGAATAISGSLEAIGTIVRYFRSEYDIKGQSLVSMDDIYVQAIVAGLLKEKDVYLLNFNLIEDSELLDDLDKLMKSHLELLTCLEKICPDALEAQVDALNKHLAGLQSMYSEALIKVDDIVLEDLKNEIKASHKRLARFRKNRISDAQAAALEAHLGELRTKLVNAIASDHGAAEAALRTEIAQATKDLQTPNLPQPKIDELVAHRKNLQEELKKVIVSKNSDIVSNLETQIAGAEAKLAQYRKNRYSSALIEAEEKHLASLRTKQAELMATNDNDAINALKMEIERVEKLVRARQLQINRANRIINSGKKITDAIDAFVEKITTAPEGGGYPPLVIACVRERVVRESETEETKKIKYLLKLKLISAGAEFITEKQWGFWRLPEVGYIGGGVVSFVLAETSGRIVAADTVHGISQMVHKIGEIPKYLNINME